MGDFCARTGTPCLFPETFLPDTIARQRSTIYLSKGLAGEAQLWPFTLTTSAYQSHQVYRFDEPAQAFRVGLSRKSMSAVDSAQSLTAGVLDKV